MVPVTPPKEADDSIEASIVMFLPLTVPATSMVALALDRLTMVSPVLLFWASKLMSPACQLDPPALTALASSTAPTPTVMDGALMTRLPLLPVDISSPAPFVVAPEIGR